MSKVLTIKEGNSKVFFDAYAQLFKQDRSLQVLTAFSLLQLLYALKQGQELKPQEPPILIVIGMPGVGKTIRLNVVMSLWGMTRYWGMVRCVLNEGFSLPLGFDFYQMYSNRIEEFVVNLESITKNVVILNAEPIESMSLLDLYKKHYTGLARRLLLLNLNTQDDLRENKVLRDRFLNFLDLTQDHYGHIDVYKQYLKDHLDELKGYIEKAKNMIKEETISLITALGMSFSDFLKTLGHEVELDVKAFSKIKAFSELERL